jgi:hypothetical protein
MHDFVHVNSALLTANRSWPNLDRSNAPGCVRQHAGRSGQHARAPQKKSKKGLAMPIGIVTRGVILRALGGTMRKFKTCSRRSLPFRLLVILAGAFTLLAAFAPRANAVLIRYYDFEGAPTAPYPVNLFSHAPAVETGAGTNLTLLGTIPPGAAYPPGNTFPRAEIALNLPPGAPAGVTALGTDHNQQFNLNVLIPFSSVTGIYDITSVSFAYAANGNGYGNIPGSGVQVFMSSDGGVTFTAISPIVVLGPTSGDTRTIAILAGTTLNIPNLVLRLRFTGGASNGTDDEFDLDNIQINGTVLPEPTTVAGGLLGILGLCWHQRRRLIRSVRLLRA